MGLEVIPYILVVSFLFIMLYKTVVARNKELQKTEDTVPNLEDSFKEKDKARKKSLETWQSQFLQLEADSHGLSVDEFKYLKRLKVARHKLTGELADIEVYGKQRHHFVVIPGCTCKFCASSKLNYQLREIQSKIDKLERT